MRRVERCAVVAMGMTRSAHSSSALWEGKVADRMSAKDGQPRRRRSMFGGEGDNWFEVGKEVGEEVVGLRARWTFLYPRRRAESQEYR